MFSFDIHGRLDGKTYSTVLIKSMSTNTKEGVKVIFPTGSEHGIPYRQQPIVSLDIVVLISSTEEIKKFINASIYNIPCRFSLLDAENNELKTLLVADGYINECAVAMNVGEYVQANIDLVVSRILL